MKMGVRIAGRKFSREWPKAIAKRGEATADEAVSDLAEQVVADVRERIRTGPKTGRVYRRSNPTRFHQASAPGQAPADDLGNLAASYNAVERKLNQYAKAATIGSSLVYAATLEYGNLSMKILPRPHLRPAITKAERLTGTILADAWRRNSKWTNRRF